MKTTILLAALFLAAPPVRTAARELHPMGPADLSTDRLSRLELALAIGDDALGIVPQIGLQFPLGGIALGVDWGFSWSDMDGLRESDLWPGNLVLSAKGKKCFGQGWHACLGMDLGLALGLAELDFPDYEEVAAEFASLAVGFLGDLRWRNFWGPTQHIVFEPTFAATLGNRQFLFKAYFGPTFFFPFDDLHVGSIGTMGLNVETDVEAAILYGAGLGAVLADFIGVWLGIRGLSTMTYGDDESFVALDMCFRLLMRGVSPGLRIDIPLDDRSRDVLDVVVSAGALISF